MRLRRLFLTLLVTGVIALLLLWQWLLHKPLPVAQEVGEQQYSWQDARQQCLQMGEGFRLPNVDELAALLVQGRLTQTATDYWSGRAIGGYAFGVNTHSWILSFDRHADRDHVVCVRVQSD